MYFFTCVSWKKANLKVCAYHLETRWEVTDMSTSKICGWLHRSGASGDRKHAWTRCWGARHRTCAHPSSAPTSQRRPRRLFDRHNGWFREMFVHRFSLLIATDWSRLSGSRNLSAGLLNRLEQEDFSREHAFSKIGLRCSLTCMHRTSYLVVQCIRICCKLDCRQKILKFKSLKMP